MNNFYPNNGIGSGLSTWIHGHGILVLLLILWSLFWKGLALWHAGRRGQPAWFIVILIINTFGILEIIYLFAIAKLKFSHLFSK